MRAKFCNRLLGNSSVNMGQIFVSASNFFSRTPEFVFQFQIHHKFISLSLAIIWVLQQIKR